MRTFFCLLKQLIYITKISQFHVDSEKANLLVPQFTNAIERKIYFIFNYSFLEHFFTKETFSNKMTNLLYPL